MRRFDKRAVLINFGACSTHCIPLLRSGLFRLDPETAHHVSMAALRIAEKTRLARAAFAGRRIELAGRGDGLEVPQPGRPGRGLDKEGDTHRRARPLGLRLHGNRHHHPAPAGGKSEAAAVPADRARGDHQPHGLQQSGHRRRRGERARGRKPFAASSASTSAKTRTRRTKTRRTITSPACARPIRWPTTSR